MTKKLKDIIGEASEQQLLNVYLNSRGINPKFVTTDTKIAHAKSSQFAKWKADHQNDRQFIEELDLYEGADKEDVLSFDIPLFIRILELAREDVKEDMELHRITERLLSIRKKGVLTMDDYDFIAGLKKIKESIEEEHIDEVYPTGVQGHLSQGTLDSIKNKRNVKVNLGTPTYKPKPKSLAKKPAKKLSFINRLFKTEETELETEAWDNSVTKIKKSLRKGSYNVKPTALERFRAAAAERAKKHAEIEKKQSKDGSGMTAAIDRLEKHLNKEEVEQIDELKKSTVFSWLKQQPVVPEKKPGMSRKDHNKKIKSHSKSWNRALDRLAGYKPTSEDTFQDSYAATQTTGMEIVDLPAETKVNRKELSKSARMIKSLYKKLDMKEELYDHEKEDKSVVTYGKKPTITKIDKKMNAGDKEPQAAAVLTGGKTLTGQNRDTLEIDPLMRKPGPLDQNKKT